MTGNKYGNGFVHFQHHIKTKHIVVTNLCKF